MFGRPTAAFDRLLEKATSKLLLDPDWESTLQICDNIRQGDVQPSYALQSIRKKVENENPHVAKFALQVLESVVKNCGSIVHVDVATREFMDFMKDQAKKRPEPVKGKVLELIQVWSHAFRNEPSYKVVQDTFTDMKREGFSFPALKESDAMFLSEKAPDWHDGELCHRCRVQFGLVQRKHHCRACGQIFCNKCSSKTSIVPKFGIEKEVRVCDACYEKLNKPATEKKTEEDLPSEYLASSLSKQPQGPPQRSEQEIQEEEELQLALALSQSEQEAKEKERHRGRGSTLSSYNASSDGTNATTSNSSSAIYAQPSKVVSAPAPVIDTSDMDPELARYLNRNYWQQKSVELKSTPSSSATVTHPSAPAIVADTKTSTSGSVLNNSGVIQQPGAGREDERYQNGETSGSLGSSTEEREQFLAALRSSIEIFVNRMRSNSQRGRSIANDSSVQTLFMTLTAMHPQLMQYIQQQEDQRAHYETLQDKLAQLKDARDALNVLRDEHREKRRREQEELERLRQIQMAQKLEVLRQKKQEYLEYQRQMALQRMQEQEMEMRRRLEQQKQEQHMRAMQYTYPQMYSTAPATQTYNMAPSTDGSTHAMQSVPPGASQPYYGLPAQQMSIPPGAPSTTGIPPNSQMPQSAAGYGAGQPVTMSGMGQYHVPPQGGGGGGYQTHTVPGGPTGYQPSAIQPPPGQMYMPSSTTSAPQQQPLQPGPAEYQPYNMHAMAGAMPQQPTYMPANSAGAQYAAGPGQPQAPAVGHPPGTAGPGQVMGNIPQGPMHHQPGPNEASLAELISFD